MGREHGRPTHAAAGRDAEAAAGERWDAYPLFVIGLVLTALLASLGPAAHVWALLAASVPHAH